MSRFIADYDNAPDNRELAREDHEDRLAKIFPSSTMPITYRPIIAPAATDPWMNIDFDGTPPF